MSKQSVKDSLTSLKSESIANGTYLHFYGTFLGLAGTVTLDSHYLVLMKAPASVSATVEIENDLENESVSFTGKNSDILIGEKRIQKTCLKLFSFDSIEDFDVDSPAISSLSSFIGLKDFYFCDCYNLSLTFQMYQQSSSQKYKNESKKNCSEKTEINSTDVLDEDKDVLEGQKEFCSKKVSDWSGKKRGYFIWNSFLREKTPKLLQPLVHDLYMGYVNNSFFTIGSRTFMMTLICRRTNRYAGVRYRKRGINVEGFVANEVETEFILHVTKEDQEASRPTGKNSLEYYYKREFLPVGSYVVHRGSVPLFWGQPNNKGAHPEIIVEKIVPAVAKKHFSRLVRDYGDNILAISLLRTQDPLSSEGRLDRAFSDLNQHESLKNMFVLKEMDFLYYEKMGMNTRLLIEQMSKDAQSKIKFYFSNSLISSSPNNIKINFEQNGIVRVNCVDCLDRTNAVQYYLAKTVFKEMLGLVLGEDLLTLPTSALKSISTLFNEQANLVSVQYGGSQALHQHVYSRESTNSPVMESSNLKFFKNKALNMFSSAKRMLNNTLWDDDKQRGYDIFLGNIELVPGYDDLGLSKLGLGSDDRKGRERDQSDVVEEEKEEEDMFKYFM